MVQKELELIEDSMAFSICVKEPLQSGIIEFLKAPSKRIRLVLPILYLKSLGEEITSKHIKFFSALEIIHNASLIHDDIIDESAYRRGERTVSNEFGNKLGVISGDYLLSVAIEIILSLESVEVLSNILKTIKNMCLGEINQNYERFKIGSIDNYINKSKNKTAYLFESALVCPLLLCSKNYNVSNASDFGLNFGIAFQIRDDLLNIMSIDDSKPSSNDILEGIYNAPVISSGGEENLSSGIEKTRLLLNNYINNAKDALSILPQNEYKTALIEISELLEND